MAGIGAQTASASTPDDSTTALFVESGFVADDRDDIESDIQVDPLQFYTVGEQELSFNAIKRSNLNKFESSDAVLRHNGFHELPHVINRGNTETLYSNLNERLNPLEGISLQSEVQFPAIRLETADDVLNVSVQDDQTRVEPGESESVEIGSIQSATERRNSVEFSPTFEVKNNGTMTISTSNVIEER